MKETCPGSGQVANATVTYTSTPCARCYGCGRYVRITHAGLHYKHPRETSAP